MEKSNNRVLNELLVNLFHNVMDAEAKAVITEEFKDITNNDMHILEAIGIEEPKSMSRIAGKLHITVGTLTTNMNSLEKKGYLERNRSTQDKRVVLVTLTEKGRKAFFHHRDFHRKMIHTIIRDLDEEEMKTLIKCLGRQRGVTGEIRWLLFCLPKSSGNCNKLFSDENKCIKIEITIGRTDTVLHSYGKRKRK